MFDDQVEKRIAEDTSNEVRKYYLECLRNSRIDPDDLLKAEMLNFDSIEKDIKRNLRAVMRIGGARKGLYFQINPAAKWGTTIGVLPVSLDVTTLTQEQLFYTQEQTFSCRGDDTAAGLFFRSRKTPCADAVLNLLMAYTLLEIKQASSELDPALELYVGIAHSEIWLKL